MNQSENTWMTFEGGLWRNDDPEPLRPIYNQHLTPINSTLELRAALRAGQYAWPGGYQLAFITSDGATLCFDCVRKEYRNISDSIRTQCDDGWRVIDIFTCYDGETESGEHCEHCNRQLSEPGDTQP